MTSNNYSRPIRHVPLLTVIVVVALPLFAYLYSFSWQQTTQLRASCEQANEGRDQFVGLLDDLISANQTRIDLAPPGDSSIPGNRAARDSYKERKAALRSSITHPASDNPFHNDCPEAFPRPFPFN